MQALRYGLDRADGASVAVAGALLGILWLTESNLGRLVALAADTPRWCRGCGPGRTWSKPTARPRCAAR